MAGTEFGHGEGALKKVAELVATTKQDLVKKSGEMESELAAMKQAWVGGGGLAFENVTFESDHAPYEPGARPWRIIPASPEIEAEIAALLADWVDVPKRFTTQIARFHDALTGKGPLPVTSADARQALEIVTAFYHSSETHKEERLPITAGHPMYESWIPAAFRN